MDFILEFLNSNVLGKETWVWLLFIGIVIALLVLDLGVLHKDNRIEALQKLAGTYVNIPSRFNPWGLA